MPKYLFAAVASDIVGSVRIVARQPIPARGTSVKPNTDKPSKVVVGTSNTTTPHQKKNLKDNSMMSLEKPLDPTEAPFGYYAVLKTDLATPKLGNICRACDWRKTCQKQDTDFTVHNHRCMSFGVISAKDGRVIQRNDGRSVVFKQLPPAIS